MYYFKDKATGVVFATRTLGPLVIDPKSGQSIRPNYENLEEASKYQYDKYRTKLTVNGWNVEVDKEHNEIHIGGHSFSIASFTAINSLLKLTVPTAGIVDRQFIPDDEITLSPAMFTKILNIYYK